MRIAEHFIRKQQVRTTGCSNVCTSSWPRLYVKIYYNIHESLHGAVCSFIHSFTHSFMGRPLSTWLCPRQWTWGTPVYLCSSCPGQGHLLPALDLLLPLVGFLISRHALHCPLLRLFPLLFYHLPRGSNVWLLGSGNMGTKIYLQGRLKNS